VTIARTEAEPVTKTLLVVDDSATMRKVFELTLLGEEVTLVTHDGSDSLLARARDARPAAAIVDVNLGSTTGYDVCRALKSDAVIGRIPVLLLFSEQNPIDEARLKDCGAEGSFSKPFESQALIDRVKQLLSTSQSQLAAVQAPAPKPTATIGSAIPSPPVITPPSSAGAPAIAKPASVGVPASAATPGAGRPKATQMFAPNVAPPAPTPPPPPSTPAVPKPPVITPPATPPMSAAPSTAVVAPSPAVAPPKAETNAPTPNAVKLPHDLEDKVAALGLTPTQVEAVAALTREVVERVVWEVVPQLAETMIREELRRLTSS
jgi:CheY-like chemotaxis protein